MTNRAIISAPPRPTKAQRARQSTGVVEPGDGAPAYERHTGSKNIRHYPPGQYSPEALDRLGEDDITLSEFTRRRESERRVWEHVPATPLIIDFTDVKQPLYPSKLHPQDSTSMHPDAAMYTAARVEARRHHPGKGVAVDMARNTYYWERIDAGTLPADFNPYRPGTDKHAAFAERVVLLDDRPTNAEETLLMTRRQVRRRAERKLKKGMHLTDEEMEVLFRPLAEWDLEELKRGRPRDVHGKFTGKTPVGFLRGEMVEKIREELQKRVRGRLDHLTVEATTAVQDLLDNNEVDGRGRPVVPASVKMRAAEFVIDHMLGKPTQRVETDLSAKLLGVLSDVMVSPGAQLTADGVVPTGALYAGQRGQRQGYDDEALAAVVASTLGRQLAIENYVDAEVVEDEE